MRQVSQGTCTPTAKTGSPATLSDRYNAKNDTARRSNSSLADTIYEDQGLRTPQLDRIVVVPSIRFGKPYVRGTRIAVGEVLAFLAGGGTETQLIEDFLQLTLEDILACLGYVAERKRRVRNVLTK